MGKFIKSWLFAASAIAVAVSFSSCNGDNGDNGDNDDQESDSSLLNPNEVKGKTFYMEDHDSKYLIQFDTDGKEKAAYKSMYVFSHAEHTPTFGEKYIVPDTDKYLSYFYEKEADGAHLYSFSPTASLDMDLPSTDGIFVDPNELVGKTFVLKYNMTDYSTTWTLDDKGYATYSDSKYKYRIDDGLTLIIDYGTTYYASYRLFKEGKSISVCQVVDYGTAVDIDFDTKKKEMQEEANKEYEEADPKPMF